MLLIRENDFVLFPLPFYSPPRSITHPLVPFIAVHRIAVYHKAPHNIAAPYASTAREIGAGTHGCSSEWYIIFTWLTSISQKRCGPLFAVNQLLIQAGTTTRLLKASPFPLRNGKRDEVVHGSELLLTSIQMRYSTVPQLPWRKLLSNIAWHVWVQ